MLLKMTLLLFTAAAAVKDRQCARIPNALIFVAACNGVFLQVYSNGWSGILKVVLGAAIPLILFGWLFALAMLGAGDLKLLMAVGVYTGPYGIVKVLLLALITGSIGTGKNVEVWIIQRKNDLLFQLCAADGIWQKGAVYGYGVSAKE